MRSAALFHASLLAAALALLFAPPARASLLVSIDKSTQRMSVTVDGTERYVWPVSTGRPGYDTPNGTFKVNRMDADHLSQEWDNAPMPHSMFFDLNGHAIHGFFDVKHLGLAVSHGCVRLSPDNASTLWDLVKAAGMSGTTVVVSGQTPAGGPAMARRGAPVQQTSAEPMQIAPGYDQQPQPYYGQQQYYRQPGSYYVQQPPGYAQQEQQGYYWQQPGYGQQQYYGQQQQYYRQPQPSYGMPAQPPPVNQFRPFGSY